MHARHLAPGARLRASRLTQHLRPLPLWRRLGQRPAQQNGRGLRRAAVHRRPRGLPQPRQHPAITRRPDAGQMRGDPPRRVPVGVEQPGRAPMGPVTLAAAQRCNKRFADNRVNEPRWVTGRQHLGPDKPVRQPRSGRHLHRPRSPPHDAARSRLPAPPAPAPGRARQDQGTAPGRSPDARSPPSPPASSSPGSSSGQRPAAALGRPQQLGQVQRITAARRIDSRTQLVARLAARRRAHHRAHRSPTQQRRTQHLRRIRANRQQAVPPPPPDRPDATPPASPPPALPAAAQGKPASAVRTHQPNARHRQRSAPAWWPPG